MRKYRIIALALAALFLLALPPAFSAGKQDTKGKPAAAASPAVTGKYKESPMLKARVDAGKLPPIEKRLPEDPLVVKPFGEIGKFGGNLNLYGNASWSFDTDHPNREQLFFFGLDGSTVEPNLARGWEFSTDGKIFTIFLRKGVKWSDGTPFTADDLMFWYEDVLQNTEVTPTIAGHWKPGGKLMKMEKVDDYTVRLSFEVAHPLIVYYLANDGSGATQQTGLITPKHYLKKFHPKYANKDELDAMVKKAGVESWVRLFGTERYIQGPGQDVNLPRLSAWIPVQASSTVVQYERNPYYWKVDPEGNQLPYIDTRKCTVITDNELVKLKLMSGELDYASIGGVSDDLTVYKENQDKGGYRIMKWTGIGNGRPSFTFNMNVADANLRKIFRDVRFRRALSLAINRKEINELQFLGLAEARQATLLPTSRFYEEKFARAYADYDVKTANQLLDEMGLKWDDKRQWRLRPDGQTLGFTLEWIEGHPLKPIELVNEYWQKVGIKSVLKGMPVAAIWNRKLAGDPEVTEDYAQDTDISFLLSGGIYLSYSLNTWSVAWRRWYDTKGKEGEEPSPEMKSLFSAYDRMIGTLSEAERVKAGKEILQLHADNVWVIGTVGNDPTFNIIRKDIGNVPESSIMAGHLNWAKYQRPEQYYWKK